ncbi:MAG: FAD-dependent monooxygenase [Hyphomicrobiales bacterium]|nr:FAD-dependent monooxygenase [Hyphomicrobiales bacterium]MBV9426331.1 FAD-dependent monooxygenase [Bradyrhizobiaceae bacterium]
MRHVDVAIAGGGLAGATVAAMLGRAGLEVTLVDPHPTYQFDFRSEKLAGEQLHLLRRTGLADAVLPAATAVDELWIARFGRIVERHRNHGDHYGILYDSLVNAMRAAVPPRAFVRAKVAAVSTGADRQTLVLANGEKIGARLLVLATGLNNGLRRMLGISRAELSPCHSISIGFDVVPAGGCFPFPALTYYPERASERISYLTLFPVGAAMRANLFIYREPRDPWIKRLRDQPCETLFAAMPGLRKLTGDFAVAGDINIRPVDLVAAQGYRQPGVVLVGDAFATSCPAAGTGVNKVLTDVERLCNVHVPPWFATPGMSAEKITAFYDDPVKRACDADSAARAFYVRSISIDAGILWQARRWGKFIGHSGLGAARRMQRLFADAPAPA